VSGPLDESRHTAIHISEDGIHVHTPKPYSELTDEERRRVDDLAAIERWQDHIYAERARRRPKQNKGENP
jgi:hypothetical protein